MQLKETVRFRDIWIDRQHFGLSATMARLIAVMLLNLLYMICRPFLAIIQLIIDTWKRMFPRTEHYGASEARRDADVQIDKPLGENDPVLMLQPIPSQPAIRINYNQYSNRPNGLFFSLLPPEIRQCILALAFGQRTMHMHLKFQSPWAIAETEPQDSTAHARFDHFIKHDQPRKWMWYGCVCHRSEPEDRPLSLGRIRSLPIKRSSYYVDGCLKGDGACEKWPGIWPRKCQIGAAGWIRSCRQAYVEGMDVLYRTNTIQISSIPLLRGMQDILTPTVLSLLTSLELVWYPASFPIKEGLQGYRSRSKGLAILPSLLYLRICLAGVDIGRYHTVQNITFGSGTQANAMEAAASSHAGELDMLIRRIAPPSADVTVTLENLEFYDATQEHLIRKQGRETTRPQTSDFGGLKCWRQIPIAEEETLTPRQLEQGEALAQGLGGYWMHIAEEVIDRGDSAEDALAYRKQPIII